MCARSDLEIPGPQKQSNPRRECSRAYRSTPASGRKMKASSRAALCPTAAHGAPASHPDTERVNNRQTGGACSKCCRLIALCRSREIAPWVCTAGCGPSRHIKAESQRFDAQLRHVYGPGRQSASVHRAWVSRRAKRLEWLKNARKAHPCPIPALANSTPASVSIDSR